jgi:predicted nucleotidyltransferase
LCCVSNFRGQAVTVHEGTTSMDYRNLLKLREEYSQKRLTELSTRLSRLNELKGFPKLTIFGAGSYARLEASEHSDIDMFFLDAAPQRELQEPKTSRIRLFAKIIDIVKEMDFPKFSNDGEFLEILHTDDMLVKLGGRHDDYENHFTTRMLLLLESKCIFHEDIYRRTIETLVRSYFRDYPRHRKDFRPIFLMNDIMRYWKTLCLNYEHKRRHGGQRLPRRSVVKQKVKNFKLKYSRMTTCFASIAYLSSQVKAITEEDVVRLVGLTPRERLEYVSIHFPAAKPLIREIQDKYCWFLQMTGLPTEALEAHFSDKVKRQRIFDRANNYGDSMFRLLQFVDKRSHVFRYLVI